MRNRYDGRCLYCGRLVKAGEGVLVNMGSKVGPAHPSCAANPYGKKEEKKP